jgi:hypothetical protein
MEVFNNVMTLLSYIVNVIAIAGWFTALYLRRNRRRRTARFFGGETLTITLPLRLLGGRRVIVEEDFRAAVELSSYLGKVRLRFDFDFVAPDGSVNFSAPAPVVICGPKNSMMISEVMKHDDRVELEEESPGRWVITDKVADRRYKSPIDEGRDSTDIAYLSRTARPGRKGTFLSIAGVHSIGSWVAVRQICDDRRLQRLSRTVGKDLFSAIVVGEFTREPLRVIDTDTLAVHRREVTALDDPWGVVSAVASTQGLPTVQSSSAPSSGQPSTETPP